MSNHVNFERYVRDWGLTPDGNPIVTHSSHLLPVSRGGKQAMLKVAIVPEEKAGAELMIWWHGVGAARVLDHSDDAILLERATGARSLAAMAEAGEDDAASVIICNAVATLHRPRVAALPKLVPLSDWFRALRAAPDNGIFARCAEAAQMLLADPRDVVPLHGDIHHGNILDFGERGWLAIDPKGLKGERGFDYANLFCNPDHPIATAPGRLARQAHVVAETAGLDRVRLLHWVLAWAWLSATWLIEDGEDKHVAPTLHVAEIAAAEIDKG
ncbi:aminoglycoside phosphotransferase family protein [Bradyrhizobium elkanii]|nr:aminoglycoside phosphotransferase family protein [Bradyrhizobium elkanii]